MFCQTTKLLAALITCIALLDVCHSARILGFFPAPSKSHLIVHAAIAEALAERGHNVTVFSTLPALHKNAKYNSFIVDVPKFDEEFINDMVNKPKPFYRNFGTLTGQIITHSNRTWMHPKTQQFLKDHKDSFDLIIFGYFMNDFLLGLAAHFNCPVIISFSVQPIYQLNRIMGNPAEIAYVPTLFSGQKQPLGFMGRVRNFVLSMFEQFVLSSVLSYRMNSLYDTIFPSDQYPSLAQMYKNVSLILTNHHFSQGPIRPNVPAVIAIGGIQVKEKPDPLPSDIAQILDNAKQGVIYFSLGSNVQGTHLTKEKAQVIFNVLAKLPHIVLWKWGDSDFPGQAANIIYKSWLPQDDILAHPNVKLFITHGGLGSVIESQYHGVPMVGIPLFGDQPANMVNVEGSGFGMRLDYLTLNEENFRDTILEVIQNKKYSEAVQEFSKLYRDRPISARQSAVYWVEYVLRHRGAKHLQSPAVYLNRWQLMSLDVIGFLLAIVFAVIAALVGICKLICCRSKKVRHNGSNTVGQKQVKTKTKTKKNKKD